MIVRDEERYLPECLQSIQAIVDEVIIVDTGSIDSSQAIARSFGAHVFECPWTGDFATARNVALDKARGEWILYIDADERVQSMQRSFLEIVLDQKSYVAYTVRFRPQIGFTPYREYRLFRNDPRIRFRGAIHETVLPGIRRMAAEDALEISRCALAIEHVGYEDDQTKKHLRNLPLLKEQLEHEPARVYSWHHLGRILQALGDHDRAREAWLNGMAVVRGKRYVDPVDSLPYTDYIQSRVKSGEEVSELIDEARRLFPDNHFFRWLHCHALVQQKKFAAAADQLHALIAVEVETFVDDRLAYDERIFREFAYDALGTCYFQLGRLKDSARFFALAGACNPSKLEYRVKRQLAEARAKQIETRH